MPEPQLSVRGADVIEMAHRLAKAEGRTVRAVVTDALREYDARHRRAQADRAKEFWSGLREEMERGRQAAMTDGDPDESEDDLYDEGGLPR